MVVEAARYYQHVRTELIEGIPAGPHRVLEVGCAEGSTSLALKTKGCASEVVGIELEPEAVAVAQERLDYVVCGDLEELSLQEPCFVEGSFDYVICGDVLEHLKDPWYQLGRLVKLLKHGGKVVVSLPNVRYYGVSFPLVFNDEWRYASAGILDSTHLRFFAKKTGTRMLSDAGLMDVSCVPLMHKRRDKILSVSSLGLFTGFVTPQWVLRGTKVL